MDDVEQLHDRSPVVGDGGVALVVVDELVHAAGAERGADDVGDGGAGVDVGDDLRLALRGVRALLQQDDLRLHHRRHGWRRREKARVLGRPGGI